MLLTCSTCFFLYFLLTVYCYAPTYQDKFLVCENLLGNKPDSDPPGPYDLRFKNIAVHMRTKNDSKCSNKHAGPENLPPGRSFQKGACGRKTKMHRKSHILKNTHVCMD